MFSWKKTGKESEMLNVLQTVKISLADLIWNSMNKKQGNIACPLFSPKGSLTVEAALVLPLFLLVSLTLLSFIDVMRITIDKQMRQQEILRSGAVTASLLSNAMKGTEGDCITIDYVYPQKLSIGGFGYKKVFVRQRSMVHIFNGYDDSRGDCIGEVQDYVYITKYGSVYHRKRNCYALNVSVKELSGAAVKGARNTDGKIYRTCSVCTRGYTKAELKKIPVYITDYGLKYHVRPNCPDLTRTVQVIKIEHAGEKTPCRICG